MLVRQAVSWLGLSTGGILLVLALELRLRAATDDLALAAIVLPALALLVSVWFGLWVGATHGLAWLLSRWFDRAWALTCAAQGLVALPASIRVSEILVEGAWISEQSFVGAARWVLCGLLVLAWVAAWVFHGLYVLTAMADRLRALSVFGWLLGATVLVGLALTFGGVLRPYPSTIAHLLLPSWLLAATLAFAPFRGRPTLALRTASVIVFACALALGYGAWRPSRTIAVRADVLGAGGLLGALALRTTPDNADMAKSLRLDFEAAARGPCPRARALPSVGLSREVQRNVIFLSIDTLRRDAIGKRYGDRSVTPNLEAFGRESMFFGRAVAPAPITLYSLGSALTGVSPSQLLWHARVPQNLFTRTRARFERQVAVLPSWPVLRHKRMRALIHQGVRTVRVPRDRDPVAPFLQELDEARTQGERGFFWLHLVEPHAPYSRHEGFDFGEDEVARYHSEVAYDDALLGRVFTHLRKTGYYADSLIVIFSDHGESLGEDGYFGHGVSVGARYIDVPLYVRHPNVRPRASNAATSLTDIAPTVLHFLGEKIPGALGGCSLLQDERGLSRCSPAMSGVYGLETKTFDRILKHPVRSLAELNRRSKQVERWARFQPEIAFSTSAHRYVVNLKTGSERVFDRASDPLERRNLIQKRPGTVRLLRARTRAVLAREAQRIVCDLEG